MRALFQNIQKKSSFFWWFISNVIFGHKLLSRSQIGVVTTLIICTIIQGAVSSSWGALMGKVLSITSIPAAEATQAIITTTAIICGVIGVNIVAGIIRTYVYSQYTLTNWNTLSKTLLEHIQTLDLWTRELAQTQNLINKVSNKYDSIEAFCWRQVEILYVLIPLIATWIAFMTLNPLIFLMVLLCSIPSFIIAQQEAKKIYADYHANAQKRRYRDEIARYMMQDRGIAETTIFWLWEKILKKYSELNDFLMEKRIKLRKKYLPYSLWASVLEVSAIGGAFVYIMHGLVTHEISTVFGGMLIQLTITMSGNIKSFLWMMTRELEDNKYVDDLREFLRLQNQLPILPSTTNAPIVGTPSLTFENVSFRYPGTDNDILHGINLTIHPGEKIALVGVNGAGKSTFIKLLCRFYDPTQGRILINGQDIRTLQIDEYYQYFSVLFQDFAKYKFTINESICLNLDTDVDEAVIQAAQRSGAHEFIKNYPKKYDEQLGRDFDGVEPSGGQWQKIAIARAFYQNRALTILDEPTSAIDAEAEMQIFEAMKQMSGEKTVLCVSHRFSTVRTMQRILVFENGTVSEDGTHESLIQNAQTYARLFALQAQGYQ